MAVKTGWAGNFYEDFEVGDVYRHSPGRTVTETDNIWFTLLTCNMNLNHMDVQYAGRTEFGRNLFNSGMTLAIVNGLTVADISDNAVANLGWDEIRLPAPVFVGDGYLMVAAGNDGLWERLCRAIGAPELLADPRFRANPDRVRHRDELAALLGDVLRTRPSAHWERVLDAAGVPASPIRTVAEVVADEQVTSLGLLRSVAHPRIDGYRDVGLPVRWDGERPATRRVPPALGADTRDVLAELGRTPMEIEALIAAGVVAADEGRTGCCQPRTTRS